ncbi:MAG: hypothetical protein AAF202_11385, partial [Pseudomonadota bacterium]
MRVIFGRSIGPSFPQVIVAISVAFLLTACGPLANNDPRSNLTDQPNHRTGFCLGNRCSTANGDTRVDASLDAMLADHNELFDVPQDPDKNIALGRSVTDLTFLRMSRNGQAEMLGSHSIKIEIQMGLETLTYERQLSITEDGGLYELALVPSAENSDYQLMGYFADIFRGTPGEEENVKTFGTFHLVKFVEG